MKEGLKQTITVLLNSGYDVLLMGNSEYRYKWLYFGKDNNIYSMTNKTPYYIENEEYECYGLSTVHKPSIDCGTGSVIFVETIEYIGNVIEDLKDAKYYDSLICRNKIKKVKYYKNLEELQSKYWTKTKLLKAKKG